MPEFYLNYEGPGTFYLRQASDPKAMTYEVAVICRRCGAEARAPYKIGRINAAVTHFHDLGWYLGRQNARRDICTVCAAKAAAAGNKYSEADRHERWLYAAGYRRSEEPKDPDPQTPKEEPMRMKKTPQPAAEGPLAEQLRPLKEKLLNSTAAPGATRYEMEGYETEKGAISMAWKTLRRLGEAQIRKGIEYVVGERDGKWYFALPQHTRDFVVAKLGEPVAYTAQEPQEVEEGDPATTLPEAPAEATQEPETRPAVEGFRRGGYGIQYSAHDMAKALLKKLGRPTDAYTVEPDGERWAFVLPGVTDEEVYRVRPALRHAPPRPVLLPPKIDPVPPSPVRVDRPFYHGDLGSSESARVGASNVLARLGQKRPVFRHQPRLVDEDGGRAIIIPEPDNRWAFMLPFYEDAKIRPLMFVEGRKRPARMLGGSNYADRGNARKAVEILFERRGAPRPVLGVDFEVFEEPGGTFGYKLLREPEPMTPEQAAALEPVQAKYGVPEKPALTDAEIEAGLHAPPGHPAAEMALAAMERKVEEPVERYELYGSPADKFHIRYFIQDNYVPNTENWERGYWLNDLTDKLAADGLGVEEVWVTNLREAYGPDHNEKTRKKAEIEAKIRELLDTAAKLNDELMKL